MSTRFRQQGRIRIDARPASEAKAAGVRNAHYGMNGGLIGGMDKNGKAFGTRGKQPGVDGSRIGNPDTPGLDLNQRMNERTSNAPAGSQLLADRQQLAKDMRIAGRDGMTPDMDERRKTLGISDASWNKVKGQTPFLAQPDPTIPAKSAVAPAATSPATTAEDGDPAATSAAATDAGTEDGDPAAAAATDATARPTPRPETAVLLPN